MRQNAKKRVENNRKKRELKDLYKQIDTLLQSGKKEEAKALLPKYQKLLDKAGKINLIHKNTAARKNSRMVKRFQSA